MINKPNADHHSTPHFNHTMPATPLPLTAMFTPEQAETQLRLEAPGRRFITVSMTASNFMPIAVRGLLWDQKVLWCHRVPWMLVGVGDIVENMFVLQNKLSRDPSGWVLRLG